jgi:co-chaperonin GroES (HSP10)
MQFPRKPFLDRVIVEVTPIEKIFEQGSVEVDLQNEHTRTRSDRGIVKAVGDGVAMAGVFIEMPVQVGDEVYFDPDTAYANIIYLLPSDQYKSGLPTYLELRVGDLQGRALRTGEHEHSQSMQKARSTKVYQ